MFMYVYVCLCIIYDLVGGFKPSEEYASEKMGITIIPKYPKYGFSTW